MPAATTALMINSNANPEAMGRAFVILGIALLIWIYYDKFRRYRKKKRKKEKKRKEENSYE